MWFHYCWAISLDNKLHESRIKTDWFILVRTGNCWGPTNSCWVSGFLRSTLLLLVLSSMRQFLEVVDRDCSNKPITFITAGQEWQKEWFLGLSVSMMRRRDTGNRKGQASSPEREKGRGGEEENRYQLLRQQSLIRAEISFQWHREELQRLKQLHNLCSRKDNGHLPTIISSPRGPFPTLLGTGDKPSTWECLVPSG